MAVSPAGLSRTPSVLAAGVNELPVPVILIGRPSAAAFVTSAATSAGEPGDDPDRSEHQHPRQRPEGRYPSDRERGRGRDPPPERRRPVPRPIPEPADRASERVRPEYEARHRPVPEVGGERHGTEVNGGEHRPEKQEGWCERDQAGGWQARPADRAEPLPRSEPAGGGPRCDCVTGLLRLLLRPLPG